MDVITREAAARLHTQRTRSLESLTQKVARLQAGVTRMTQELTTIQRDVTETVEAIVTFNRIQESESITRH